MDPNAGAMPPAAAGRNAHVYTRGGALANLEMRSGPGMGKHRRGAACQDGGHPIRLDTQRAMANGVDRAVEAMETLGPKPLLNSRLPESKPPQLLAGHDAVLPFGKSGQPRLDLVLVTFSFHLKGQSEPPMTFAPPRALG